MTTKLSPAMEAAMRKLRAGVLAAIEEVGATDGTMFALKRRGLVQYSYGLWRLTEEGEQWLKS